MLSADGRTGPAERRLPGATAVRACAAAGPFWPTMTLALHGGSAWVACKEQRRVVRVDLARRRVAASVALNAPAIAVASGYGSISALDSSSTLSRIQPGRARVTKRIAVGAVAPHNVWIGGGALWVLDDRLGQVIRVSPATGRVVKKIRSATRRRTWSSAPAGRG